MSPLKRPKKRRNERTPTAGKVELEGEGYPGQKAQHVLRFGSHKHTESRSHNGPRSKMRTGNEQEHGVLSLAQGVPSESSALHGAY